MKKKYYWIIGIVIITLIILFGFLYTFFSFGSTLPESTSKQVAETTQLMKCCGECINAFKHSPISVGKEMINCINFAGGGTSEEFFLSKECETFFQNKPKTVSECGG